MGTREPVQGSLRAAVDRRSRQAPRDPQAGPRDGRRGGDRDLARYGDGAGDLARHRDPRLPRRLDRDARRPRTKSPDRDPRAPRRTPPRRDLPRGDGGAHGRRREPALLPALRPGRRRHAPVLVSDGPQDRVVGHAAVPLGGPGHRGGPAAGGDDVRGGRPGTHDRGVCGSSPSAPPGSPHRRNANCGIRRRTWQISRRWWRTSMPRGRARPAASRASCWINCATPSDSFAGWCLASPEGDLELLAATEAIAPEAVPGGLDPLMSRAWSERSAQLVRQLDPTSDPRLASLLPDVSQRDRGAAVPRRVVTGSASSPSSAGTAGPCGGGRSR